MSISDTQLVDPFGRRVDYLRLSVTDRCDFRCVYCMAEDMQFVPKPEVLTLEELYRVAEAFVGLGVRKIRLTGGEPLIRNGIMHLVERLGALDGLEQLVMTSNGSQLQRLARPLREAGVHRINISLDSLQPRRFRRLTRYGNLDQVIAGIDAACEAGFDKLRLNAVILRGRNDDEIPDLLAFAMARGVDLAFIEEMPLGAIDEHSRAESHMASADIEQVIERAVSLAPITEPEATAGPARYRQVIGSSTRVGFISPHSNNFCHLCNRVRLTVDGRLLLCLGNEHAADLRAELRRAGSDRDSLQQRIVEAIARKPERHHFELEQDEPQILRFMNMTGG
jgi:cyclic pyranopterin phosphate synthase